MVRVKEHLRNVPLFADLSEEDLDRLCEGSELIELAPDEALVPRGRCWRSRLRDRRR